MLLLVALLVYWGTSNQKKLVPQLKLSAMENTVQKKINVSGEVFNLQDSFANVAEAVKPATVNISIVQLLKLQAPNYDFYYGDPFEEFFHDFFGAPPNLRTRSRPASVPRA